MAAAAGAKGLLLAGLAPADVALLQGQGIAGAEAVAALTDADFGSGGSCALARLQLLHGAGPCALTPRGTPGWPGLATAR
jgi:hypothetical protein